MRNKVKGRIAGFLVLIILIITIFPNNVFAAELSPENSESNEWMIEGKDNTVPEENQASQRLDEIESEESSLEQENDVQQSTSGEDIISDDVIVTTPELINYVGI